MTSKTKLLPQAENGKKIVFQNFIVPSATLSVTNEPFCSDQGDKSLSSLRKDGVKFACKQSSQKYDQTVTVKMPKLQLRLHVQAQENHSHGVEEPYTIFHSIT